MTDLLTARDARFAATLTAAVLAMCACAPSDAAERMRTPSDLQVIVLAPGDTHAMTRGAMLAGTEAARAASLVQRTVSVSHEPTMESLRARLAHPARVTVLMGGETHEDCLALDALAARQDWIYVNVACEAPALRDATRHPRALHLALTPAMRRGAGESAPVVRWHGDLERYGAAQLNERYRRRYGAPMGDTAYAAWLGVKILSDAMLRAPSPMTAISLVHYLERLDVAFDGHQGEPLRFGADDHQLRLPLHTTTARQSASSSVAARDVVADSAAGRLALPTAADRGDVIADSVPLLVVSNEGSASLSVLHAGTLVPLRVIPLGHRPRGIHTAPASREVLVAVSDAQPQAEGSGDAVLAVDVQRGVVRRRIPAGSDPEQFGVSPTGSILLTANEDAGLATITPLNGGAPLASLAVGIEPEGVAISPDGRWGYVTAETSNTVSVIDLRRHTVTASFLVGVRPRAVAFAPNGREAFISNEISGTITVARIAGISHAVTRTIALGETTKPVGIAIAPDSRTAYVALGGAHAVAVLDVASGREVARIAVGRRPWHLVLSPGGDTLYAANGASGTMSVIDTRTRTVLATVPVGERPWGITYVR